MGQGKEECDYCKDERKVEDLVKCAYCGRQFCDNCIYGSGSDAMCMECSMVGRENRRL